MRWKEGYIQLCAHIEQKGALPSVESKLPLALWLKSQMLDWTKLSDERLKLLWDLGVKFGWREQYYIPRYLELVQFQKQHGHCRVTDSHDKRLAKWVRRIRQDSFRFLPLWIGRLDQIGFTWDVLEEDWQRHIEDLQEFIGEHGHAHVPMHYEKCPSLSLWVNNVRSGNSRTGRKRRQELVNLGFDFEPWDGIETRRKRVFSEHLEEIFEFKGKYGHADIPSKCDGFSALCAWIKDIRGGHVTLTTTQHNQLLAAEVDLRPRLGRDTRASGGRNYAKHLKDLKAFISEYGHTRVSTRNERYKSLASWLSNLRRGIYRLETKERDELEAMGVDLSLQVKHRK